MTSTRNSERLFTAWMSGAEVLRDDVLAGVAAEVRRTAQHRGVRSRWARLPVLVRAVAMTTGAVAVLAITVAGIGLLGVGGTGPWVGGPRPAISASPSAS